MRTTLTIDDDVLAAARSLATHQHRSLGEVISELSRQALRPTTSNEATTRNGVPLLPHRKSVPAVTPELVNRLRDESA